MEKLDNSWDLHLGDDIGIWHGGMAWSLVHGLFGMFIYLVNFCFWTFLCCSFVVDISMCCMSFMNNLCLLLSFVSNVSCCNCALVDCILLSCLRSCFLRVKGEIPRNLDKLKMSGGDLCIKMQRLLFKMIFLVIRRHV